jgi:hypothetical protein
MNGNAPAAENNGIRSRFCQACGQKHVTGYCPLKRTGVEHCGLCGLAHFGAAIACPHYTSETQVRLMLDALKTSTESRQEIEMARNYLRGIIGSIVKRKKQRKAQMLQGPQPLHHVRAMPRPPTYA